MEEGFLADRGDANMVKPARWVDGTPERSFWTGTKTRGKEQYRVTTFRCDRCGYLESYAAEP
jgi:hypothetical protein